VKEAMEKTTRLGEEFTFHRAAETEFNTLSESVFIAKNLPRYRALSAKEGIAADTAPDSSQRWALASDLVRA
jgi:hypothetical protein